ncbi:MAG TPA: hypothetical protein VLJ60_03270 [bacterium]|nr:hypothetical protein [bacterium]
MKRFCLFILLGIVFISCSDKKNNYFNDYDIIDTGQTDKEDLPGDNNSLPDEESDADTEIPERECETLCGKGIEQYIDGNWQNCTAPKSGDKRDCENMNTYGTCSGFETCDEAAGWGECDAREPEPEYYDGIDNNCNDETDENIINPVTDGSLDDGLEKIDGSDPGNPTGEDGITLSRQSKVLPYLWAANHTAESVSKFNTQTFKEEGRYWVGINPSRTAVDLDGNMWVGGRDDGRVTKVLWDTTKCPDDNSDGIYTSYIDGTTGEVVQVNSVADPFVDECVVYSEVTNPSFPSVRGMAVGSDGKIWIGYSYGGIQSIDPETFVLGTYHSATSIPVWRPDVNGVFQVVTGEMVNADGVYGLIVDSNGILYISSLTNRRYLVAFDTKTETWIGAFEKDGVCSYGIAVDAKNRIWLGGYPDCMGIAMFDFEQKKAWSFLVPDSATLTPGGTSTVQVHEKAAGGGKLAHDTTGVTVDPATGHIWTSFYLHGYTGKMVLDETDFSNSSWTFIATTRDPSNILLPGVGVDLRGVGLDPYGYVWTLGLGSDRVWKIDPATNARAADLPEGKSIGVGSHYTYSDFTGSTAFNFTAPRGVWSYRFGKPSACSIPSSIFVTAYVPDKTYIGVRLRSLDKNSDPITGWMPEIVTTEKYFVIPKGLGETEIDLADYREYFLTAAKYEIEVLMTTTDKSVLPILNNANVMWEYDSDACAN